MMYGSVYAYMNNKINLNRFRKGYMMAFCILMLIICSVNTPVPWCEWDDYSMPIASILNDCNFTISERDVAAYKNLFPEWASNVDDYQLSGYISKDRSGEMPWYFPTYGIACIPCVLILRLLQIPTIYAFPYTNLFFLMLSLYFVHKFLKADEDKKTLLILMMSINAIVFYISWPSAEVFIFSMLLMAMVCWHNRWDKRSAIFLSIAGTLNPTIMAVGIVMIVDYMIRVVNAKDRNISWNTYIKNVIPEIILYGSCYIVGVIPMVYNYYNVGSINLSSSMYSLTHGNESTISRFIAYIIDLNFGILPYYPIPLILGGVLLFVAVWKKHIRYLELFLSFLAVVMLYSIVTHINCGMSGISRYNSWGSVLLLFTIILYYGEMIGNEIALHIVKLFLIIGMAITGLLIMYYNPFMASRVPYTSMSPVAKYVLERCPELYNPLYSTFNSRVNHLDSGYDYTEKLPIVYQTDDGYAKKILATKENKTALLSKCQMSGDSEKWFEGQLNSLDEVPSYISIPPKYSVLYAKDYKPGTELLFSSGENNSDDYVVSGLSIAEDWGKWTDGNKLLMRFVSTTDSNKYAARIDCIVYNNTQDVIVSVNNKKVFRADGFEGGTLDFEFDNPGDGRCVDIEIELPKAISPYELGVSKDKRELGLGLMRMVFTEKP